MNVSQKLTRTVAQMANIRDSEVDLSKTLTANGLDSMSLLVFRETCERQFGVYIPDSTWTEFRSVEELGAWLEGETDSPKREEAGRDGSGASLQAPTASKLAGGRYKTGDSLCDEIEIGMPFTGINNLSENSLLKYVGDLRWAHLSQVMGMPSKEIVDEDGNRLYATFFYVEVAFPERRPMAAYIENDRVLTVSNIARFGGSMIDGVTSLLPPGVAGHTPPPPETTAEAISRGVPAIRLSNIFVRQFSGAEWLKKARPASAAFARIRELAVAPDSYVTVKMAEAEGHFRLPDSTYVPLTNEIAHADYKLIPERDVNGVGLVYFANYPVFLDICERDALTRAGMPLTEDMCNRRTVLHRKSAYLNNASWRDTLHVETQLWIQNPYLVQPSAPEMAPIRLLSNQRMYRKSDGRLMMVSTAEKLIFGAAMEDVPFFAELQHMRA